MLSGFDLEEHEEQMAMLKFKGSEGSEESEFAGRTLGTLRARTMLLLLWWISQMPLASAKNLSDIGFSPVGKIHRLLQETSRLRVYRSPRSRCRSSQNKPLFFTPEGDRLLEPRTPTYFSVCLAGDGASPGAFYLSPEDEGSDLRCGDADIAVERGSDTRVF